jgi:hypothetical protein
VTFVQRFGSALNAHTHLHCCVNDGVFSLDPVGTLHFHPAVDLDAAALSAVQRRIRVRVLRLAVRHDVFTPDVAAGNAVFRWEYRPGSTFFLVWTRERTDQEGINDFDVGPNFRRLVRADSDNIFLAKVTYYLNL